MNWTTALSLGGRGGRAPVANEAISNRFAPYECIRGWPVRSFQRGGRWRSRIRQRSLTAICRVNSRGSDTAV